MRRISSKDKIQVEKELTWSCPCNGLQGIALLRQSMAGQLQPSRHLMGAPDKAKQTLASWIGYATVGCNTSCMKQPQTCRQPLARQAIGEPEKRLRYCCT